MVPYKRKTAAKGPDDHGKKQPPDRPGHGDRGKEIRLYTNFFLLKLPDTMTVHHYDVSMIPEKLSKALVQQVSKQGGALGNHLDCKISYVCTHIAA